MTRRKLTLFTLLTVAIALLAFETVVRHLYPNIVEEGRSVPVGPPAPTPPPAEIDINIPMQFTNPHRDQPESFVRDPALFWRLKPDNAAWQVNADGYRGPRREPRKPPGVLRIITLGDSCTFGLGAPLVPFEQTYPALLEQDLTRRLNRPVEVLNFACPGYTSWQGLQLLRLKGLVYQPDIVTAYFGINDGFPAIGYADKDQKPLPSLSESAGRLQSLLHRSAAYIWLAGGIMELRKQTGRRDLPRVSFEEFRENASAMQKLGEENGFTVLFLPAQFIGDDGQLGVEEISRVEPSVALHEVFLASEKKPEELLFPPPDRVHPTPAGHALIAQTLSERIAAGLRRSGPHPTGAKAGALGN